MSTETNISLLEHAAELIDELASHPSGADEQLIQAVESNDLQKVRYLVTKFEAELSREHFYSYGVVR